MKITNLLVAALAVFTIVAADSCPAGTCDSGQTCCELSDGQYGCCPYPQAVCCSDHSSCCPNGYTCDVKKSQCVQKADEDQAKEEIQLDGVCGTVRIGARTGTFARDVSCADGSSCPSTDTCCQLQSGEYGCCPYPQAVCCSDKESCCPNGYTCDLTNKQCVQSARQGKALGLVEIQARTVNCADGSQCNDGSTCCQLQSGGYGCCPYPQAVCCSDKESCCPNGYTCDLKNKQCDQNGKRSLEMLSF